MHFLYYASIKTTVKSNISLSSLHIFPHYFINVRHNPRIIFFMDFKIDDQRLQRRLREIEHRPKYMTPPKSDYKNSKYYLLYKR